jgi:hypothetical protein
MELRDGGRNIASPETLGRHTAVQPGRLRIIKGKCVRLISWDSLVPWSLSVARR